MLSKCYGYCVFRLLSIRESQTEHFTKSKGLHCSHSSSFYFCISQLLIITFPLSSSIYSTTWELHSQLLSIMVKGINSLDSGFLKLNCLLMTDNVATCHFFIFSCAFSRLRKTTERTNMEDTESDKIEIVSSSFLLIAFWI